MLRCGAYGFGGLPRRRNTGDGLGKRTPLGMDAYKSTQAVILLRDGAQLTEDDVRTHLAGRLARYKIPKSVLFIDEMPRTASGKIRKTDLRTSGRHGRGPEPRCRWSRPFWPAPETLFAWQGWSRTASVLRLKFGSEVGRGTPRICSAVLVQVNGVGLVFHSVTHFADVGLRGPGRCGYHCDAADPR